MNVMFHLTKKKITLIINQIIYSFKIFDKIGKSFDTKCDQITCRMSSLNRMLLFQNLFLSR